MNERYLRSLVKLTKVTSEATLNATIEHLVYGDTQALSAKNNSVLQGSVGRLATRLIELDKQVTELNKLKNSS